VSDAEVEDSVAAVAGHQPADSNPVRVRSWHDHQRLAIGQAFVVELDDFGRIAPALEELEYPLPDPVPVEVENAKAVGAVQEADDAGRRVAAAVAATWRSAPQSSAGINGT